MSPNVSVNCIDSAPKHVIHSKVLNDLFEALDGARRGEFFL